MGNRTNDYLLRVAKFEITPQPDGRYALKTNGTQGDNEAGLPALAMLTAAPVAPQAPVGLLPPSPALRADVPTPPG